MIVDNNFNNNLPGALICYNCRSQITSVHHRSHCNTVFMFGLKKSNYLEPDFKPMMTYGLGGCSVLVMINQSTNQIFFGHHPELSQVISWFNNIYNESNQFIVIVKSPGEWVKINEQWTMVSQFEQKIKNIFAKPNVNLILEPYNLSQSIDDNYESSLYLFKKSDNMVYTDNNGENVVLF
jgi:hypothetical protein